MTIQTINGREIAETAVFEEGDYWRWRITDTVGTDYQDGANYRSRKTALQGLMEALDPLLLATCIPEGRGQVEGLEYGGHVSCVGWTGYHVRPEGSARWGIARQTPVSYEIEGDDAAIVSAIEEELREAAEEIRDAQGRDSE